MLHGLALSSTAARDLTFDIEKGLFLRGAGQVEDNHVFVAGLARAGTTALLNALYSSGEFASLTYDDMPFVLAPNLWARLTGVNKKTIAYGERAHGDGIQVSSKSPEALDEVFWSNFSYEDCRQDDRLRPYAPEPEALEEYAKYIALVCRRYGKSRYLCKNNNNIFRLADLARAFPGSAFIVPFRAPEHHAASLSAQNARFADASEFERKYMRWLGHFEFGATHLRYDFDGGTARFGDPADCNYWLEMWINTYRWLLPVIGGAANIVPVCYEELSAEHPAYVAALAGVCGVAINKDMLRPANRPVSLDFDAGLLATARDLYRALRAASREKLPG